MCISETIATQATQSYLEELVAARLLLPLGVPGVYARSGVFEDVIDRFEGYVTRIGAAFEPQVLRFPPVMNRAHYLQTNHLRNFPNLMGSVHTFDGDERDHMTLLEKRECGADWTCDLSPTHMMLTPATCYPLYPTARGILGAEGRTVDLQSYVFRHEPSLDPARLQSFRMREYVRLGSAEQALHHRDGWLVRAQRMLHDLQLDVKAVVASDPFFGRGGRMMAATQKEQVLKYELVVPIADADKPTAVASCNYHLDYFGQTFDIRTPDGKPAHSACVGFGLERIALALFRTHGFDPDTWPMAVQRVLQA